VRTRDRLPGAGEQRAELSGTGHVLVPGPTSRHLGTQLVLAVFPPAEGITEPSRQLPEGKRYYQFAVTDISTAARVSGAATFHFLQFLQ
jgi:hypothetical protein